jgi:hypothetical protein
VSFLSRDPIAALTRQPYAHVSDNPLNATDPAGLDPREFEGLSEAVRSQYEFTQYGAQAFAKRGLNQVWADKIINNALRTYTMADGSTASVSQYTPGRFGLVVRNAAGNAYNGYRGLQLSDICRMARSFGYQDFERADLDNAAKIEVAVEEALADPAPVEKPVSDGIKFGFVPGHFGGGHDVDN